MPTWRGGGRFPWGSSNSAIKQNTPPPMTQDVRHRGSLVSPAGTTDMLQSFIQLFPKNCLHSITPMSVMFTGSQASLPCTAYAPLSTLV